MREPREGARPRLRVPPEAVTPGLGPEGRVPREEQHPTKRDSSCHGLAFQEAVVHKGGCEYSLVAEVRVPEARDELRVRPRPGGAGL